MNEIEIEYENYLISEVNDENGRYEYEQLRKSYPSNLELHHGYAETLDEAYCEIDVLLTNEKEESEQQTCPHCSHGCNDCLMVGY